jgi:integrase
MAEINPFLLQAWRKRQLEGGKSPVTVNRDLADLKALLSKAVELGLLAVHPLARLKPAKTEDNSRIRHLSPEEEKRLFAALAKREAESRAARTRFNKWRQERKQEPRPEIPDKEFSDHLKPMVLLALHTGLRRGELFSAEWRDIDFLNNRLTVRAAAAKGAKPRHIPLNATARDTLKQWQKQTVDAGLIFPGAKGGRLDNIASSWRNLVAAAKLRDFTFHDLRHTFATNTLARGADIVTVSKLLGHASLKMTLRYAHVTDEALTAAVERLAANGKPL